MGPETLALPAPPVASTPVPKTLALAQAPPPPPPTALAPGFRFHPTDEELVIYYLKRKVLGKSFRFDAISEVDIYKSEPWDLGDKSRLKTRDQEWYFFSALDRKYGNGGRMNRATGKGYWKATGNDRPVRHDSRTVGLKKTLVFHSGRAPDGKRTNWVMHEYRLIEEELERSGVGSTQDAYVLCRVFHKNNIGPPNGQRYAPFIEDEWDDNKALVPGEGTAFETPAFENRKIESNGYVASVDNSAQDRASLDVNRLPVETQSLLAVCKREMEEREMEEKETEEKQLEDKDMEDMEEDPSHNVPSTRPFSLIYKRRRQNNPNSINSNNSDSSTRLSQDPSSSTATISEMTLATVPNTSTSTKSSFLSALVEYSLIESLEPKERSANHLPEMDTGEFESSLPPECLKIIQGMQQEIHKLSVERETLSFEMMSAQAMINILQSRIVHLNKENDDLRRRLQDD